MLTSKLCIATALLFFCVAVGCSSIGDNNNINSTIVCKQCNHSQSCINGHCFPGVCVHTSDCSNVLDNFICAYDFNIQKRTCRVKRKGECSKDSECNFNNICDGGKCYESCKTSASCSNPYVCDPILKRCVCDSSLCKKRSFSGCRPDTRLCYPFCTTSETVPVCGPQSKCIGTVKGSRLGFCLDLP